jgi:hypothetical protein
MYSCLFSSKALKCGLWIKLYSKVATLRSKRPILPLPMLNGCSAQFHMCHANLKDQHRVILL